MNEPTDGVDEEYLLCFDPDLESFRTLCSHWLDQWLLKLPSCWPSIPYHADFVDYCCFALRFYSHLMSTQTFTRFYFASDSSAKLNTYNIHVPVYILDMIREICRPMYTNKYVELRTYFPLIHKGLGIVPGLGMLASYGAISSWVIRSEMPSKPIVEENVGTTPVCIVSSDKRHYGYSNGCVLPTFRQEAIKLLKFISIHPRFILGSRARESCPGQAIAYRVPVYGESWISESISETTVTSNLTAAGYSRDDDCFIHDTELRRRSYYDILGSREESCYLTTSDTTGNVGDDFTNPENAIGLDSESLGLIPVEYLALIMRAYSLTNLDFEERNFFRSKFNFGNSYAYKILPTIINIGNRFPSDENPSKESKNDKPTVKIQTDRTSRKQKKQPTISPPNPDGKSAS